MLLVAVDVEGCAWQVVEEAARLAADLGLPAHLTTVVDLPDGLAPDTPLHGQYEGETARHLLQGDTASALQGLAKVFEQHGVQTRIGVRHGDVVSSILACVEEVKPRFLVVGTHGRRGLKRLLLGSVAEQLIRVSPVPVVVIRAEGEAYHPSAAREAIRAEADG